VEELKVGSPVLTSLFLVGRRTLDVDFEKFPRFSTSPKIHIVPWIGSEGFPERLVAWEPVDGAYIYGFTNDLVAALAEDRWHCRFRPIRTSAAP